MTQYQLVDVKKVLDGWFAATDDAARRRALLAWLEAAVRAPEMVKSYEWERVGIGRPLVASTVRTASAVVVWSHAVAPVQVLFIVDVVDLDGVDDDDPA